MTRGMSLHIGVNRVDPDHYSGWTGELSGCENDADDMAAIATSRDFAATVVKTAAATSDRVLSEFARAAASLHPGDTFLVSFAGHGTQLPTRGDPEPDGLDETMVLHDRMVRDDEIYRAFSAFRRGVRLFMVADSCTSGSLTRLGGRVRGMSHDLAAQVVREHPGVYEALPPTRGPVRRLVPDVLLLSACQDGETTGDGDTNGAFTAALRTVWADGAFTGDHRALRKGIDDLLPDTQNPGLDALTAAASRLEDDAPFTLSGSIGMTTTHEENAMSITVTPNTDTATSTDNGADVLAALGERLPIDGLPAGLLTPAVEPDGIALELSGARPAAGHQRDDGIAVRTFWWGFHVQIDHPQLERILASADGVNALVGAIGGSIPSPAQPWIVLVAKFVTGVHALLRHLDEGNGVYISMTWAAPGVFVPSTVPAGRSGPTREVVLVHDPLDFDVPRVGGEVDTGLVIQPGQRLVINASGSVWSGIWATGTNGPGGWMDWEAGNDAPLPGRPPFSLLARLDGTPHYVGIGAEWVHSGRAAKLFFLINDHRRIGNGSFQVHVAVYSS
ncbi:caspase family protein [Actinomycetospora aeridis]|uniref:Caspase family protein n=1 Tax=Actinomycetospora aeridis TaxID=3129231 RepID=A0ABU8N7P9_9PSEU